MGLKRSKTGSCRPNTTTKTRKPNVHKWDRRLLANISPLVESNNYMGVIQVLEDWGIISITVLFCKYSFQANFFLGIITYLVAITIIGARMRALADLLHQSSHGCLAKNENLNFFLGTFCSGYLVFQSFSIYHESHVRKHHVFLGNAAIDPDYQEYIRNGLCGESRSAENTKQYLFSIFSPTRSLRYMSYVLRNRIYNPNEPSRERKIRVFYYLVVFLAIVAGQAWFDFLVFWMIPFMTTNIWIGAFLELCEHFPMVDGTVEYKDVFLTRNRVTSWISNFILGTHWEGFHLVHHLFPKVPSWNYERVHRILLEDEVYRNVDHGDEGWVRIVSAIVQESELPQISD